MWYEVPCCNVVLKLLLRKLNCLWLAVLNLNNDVSDGLIESNQR